MSKEQSCDECRTPLFAIVPLGACTRYCRTSHGSRPDERIFRKFLMMMMSGKIKLSAGWWLNVGNPRHAEIIAHGLNEHFGANCSVLLGDCVSLKSRLTEDEINTRITHWHFYLSATTFKPVVVPSSRRLRNK